MLASFARPLLVLRPMLPLTIRMRRLRASPHLRRMVRETSVAVNDLVQPLFVAETIAEQAPVPSMPGVCQWPLRQLVDEARRVRDLGVPAVLLFGIPAIKDGKATAAWNDNGVVQTAVRALKEQVPALVIITDVCLCGYMDHGHCGVTTFEHGLPRVDNDASVELLARTAVSHAAAGADIVAPSDMMDGRIGAIRQALDAHHYEDTIILSYAAKFASAFYGPFREAAESAPGSGDRRSYQLDCANTREAMREIELDLAEGADIVMIKPGIAYLDIIARARDRFDAPIAVYNVSGEYAMIKAAAANGWIDERSAVLEAMVAFKRAGADLIITYWAAQVAEWMRAEA
jgi:porphobilinogen synthase